MEEGFKIAFDAIGTGWVIDIYGKKPEDYPRLKSEINEEIKKFSDIFSRFDENSKIYKASTNNKKVFIEKKYRPLLNLYKKFYEITAGKLTPLIGSVLEDAGYDSVYSLVPKKIRPVKKWEDVLIFEKGILGFKENVILDFGAAGKGFLIDLLGSLLEKNGINSYCIDGSGDILYKSKLHVDAIKVGLEHPQNPEQVIGVAEIKNESICASAGNRRKWKGYNHIFDPDTLKSVENILAVWVISKTAVLADVLATCLFLVKPEKLREFKFEYLILKSDLTAQRSADFPAEIFYN